MSLSRRILTLILPVVLLLGASSGAQAQYFGSNKVQYKSFKFEVLKTEHFDVYFYEVERENAVRVGRMAERWYTRFSQIFQHDLSSRQPIVLYASHPDFEQTNVVGGEIGEGTGGVTEGMKRRVVLPLAGSLAETDHVLGHELVHAFQYDISSQRQAGSGNNAAGGVEALPLWFVEGLAEYLSLGPLDPHTAMWIRDASREDRFPTINDLSKGEYFPYRWGQAVWAYLGGRYGDDAIGGIFRDGVRSGSAEMALKNISGLDNKTLSAEWHTAIRDQYDPVMSVSARAASFGRIVSQDKEKNATNVSPSLSPDGKYVVFFSARELLSIDLYLVETATGRVVRKLVDTATNPHFTTLQFIGSAGAWSPDSKQFVVPAVRSGKAVLAFLDVNTGKRIKEIELPSVGEVLNPSWSPDGQSIVYSATVGGDTDLFIHDLAAGTDRRLTTDVYSDLQPAWSPDGRKIAFVTDRYTTVTAQLTGGQNQLALFDVETGAITPLKTFAIGKSINPQWQPDNRRLFFISDRSGISNVYSIDVESGATEQLTNVDSGISGITALSPAISSAIDARTLALSAYQDGSYHIYMLNTRPPDIKPDGYEYDTAAMLPPLKRDSLVANLLSDSTSGLPADDGEMQDYKAGLSLDAVGQPYIGAGIGQFGGTLSGGIAFSFSDMLNNHSLYFQVDANTAGSSFSDIADGIGVLTAYTNMTHRLNWSLILEQTPYMAGGYAQGVSTSNGQTVFLNQEIIQRQINRGLTGVAAYPLSRTRRIEGGAGFTRTTFNQTVRTVTYSPRTGQVLSDQTERSSLGETLNLSNFQTALVSDSSIFGATSPIAGGRSRFEISPTFGTLRFASALVDYRKYFMPARFYTIALRGLHYGRYGDDAEDPRLVPLFIGYPEFVRGYGIGSFDALECNALSCQSIDQMSGSRIAVANAELRFPLLRPFGVSDRMYGPIPVEVAFFLDSGVAWNKNEHPIYSGGRPQVSSGGVTFRANLFNFAVAQIDIAHPFDRPGKGWVWGFSLNPGF